MASNSDWKHKVGGYPTYNRVSGDKYHFEPLVSNSPAIVGWLKYIMTVGNAKKVWGKPTHILFETRSEVN